MNHVVCTGGIFRLVLGPSYSRVALEKEGFDLHRDFPGCRCAACRASVVVEPGSIVTADVTRALLTGWKLFASEQPEDLPPVVASSEAVPVPPGMTLRAYQLAAVEFARARFSKKNQHVLIADDMGLGKTCTSIAACNLHSGATKFLVICPASLRLNWEREIRMWDPFDPQVLQPRTPEDLPKTLAERTWVIVNPEILIASRTKTGEQVERGAGLWNCLMAIRWDVLILDEAHRFKNMQANRTERVLGKKKTRKEAAVPGLAQKSTQILALTGTPIPNRVREIWPLVSMLAPEAFPKEFDFLRQFCGAKQVEIVMRGGHGEKTKVWDFSGASNLARLQSLLRGSCMIRRLKVHVLKELPAKTRQVITLPADEFKKEADCERKAWLSLAPRMTASRGAALLAEALEDPVSYDEAMDRLTVDLEGIDVAKIGEERQALALSKVPLVVEHVKDLLEEEGRKVVVMAHHHSVVERLRDAFPGSVCVYGSTPMAERQASVDAFQRDAKVRVFIGGIHAAGVGLTLTAATHMVFAEGDWQPGVLSQAEDRIHRIGQTGSVLIQYIVIDGTIEALVLASALRKQKIIEQALDALPGETRPRKTYPVASTTDVGWTNDVLKHWAKFPLPNEKTNTIVAEILVRVAMRQAKQARAATDGEVWLCKKIARENLRSLPGPLRTIP